MAQQVEYPRIGLILAAVLIVGTIWVDWMIIQLITGDSVPIFNSNLGNFLTGRGLAATIFMGALLNLFAIGILTNAVKNNL